MQKTVFILLCLFLTCFAKRYDNYAIVQLKFTTQEKLSSFFSLFPQHTLDILSPDQGASVGIDMQILFTPQQYHKLLNSDFLNSEVTMKVITTNAQLEIEKERRDMLEIQKKQEQQMSTFKTQQERDNFLFREEEYYKSYHNSTKMIAYLDTLAANFPKNVDKVSIGKSLLGKDLFVYRIHSEGPWDPSKPAIWFNSLIHAREWISGATTNYLVYKLLTSDIHLLDKVNIHYMPILNIDGYDYTWSHDRLWRKNRRGNSTAVWGVDLNRNFQSAWGGQGSSSNIWSQTYRGASPLSEPETKAVDEYFKQHGKNIKLAIDYHSYSQYVLRCCARTTTPSQDENQLKQLGQIIVDAIKKTPNGETYQNWRWSQMYVATGVLSDTWYDVHKVKASYTIELRDKGSYGFRLPERFILPTAQENYSAMKDYIKYIANL